MASSSALLLEIRPPSRSASTAGLLPPSGTISAAGERSSICAVSEAGSKKSSRPASVTASGAYLMPPDTHAYAGGSQASWKTTKIFGSHSASTIGSQSIGSRTIGSRTIGSGVTLQTPSAVRSADSQISSTAGSKTTEPKPTSVAASLTESKKLQGSLDGPSAAVKAPTPPASSITSSLGKSQVTIHSETEKTMVSDAEKSEKQSSVADDDIFAPTDERVQTIDFSKIRTQSIQVTKNEQKKKANVLESLKKQVKNFFHEDRATQDTDEQGNVELPMDPCVQAREDHDSGLLPSERLFRLARREQQLLRDRNIQHQKPRHHHSPGDPVDDYEFAWMVKRLTKSAATSAIDRANDAPDGIKIPNGNYEATGAGDAHRTTGNTHGSKVGSNTIEFRERIDAFETKQDAAGQRGEGQRETEQERALKAQLLSMCGLVAAPTLDVLSTEERKMLEDYLQERSKDATDGAEEKYPCDCCGPQATSGSDSCNQAATCYDLLFGHRKSPSFTVRFDLVHCLPRFVLHYKFHKLLYDCLDAPERRDLVKAATDITLSYSLGNCTLQLPYGKYRTNAHTSFFAYIIVPDHVRYLEIFEVCNPPVKLGEKRKQNRCIVPNWPDKSYVTEFWVYSKESNNEVDKDPRLADKLYEKNVLRKLQMLQMPELLVTRRSPPSELTSGKLKANSRMGNFELFEDFVLIPHQDQPMLGFGSVSHPTHAATTRSGDSQMDIVFLDRLMRAMCAYVRRFVNTRQRRLAGREELSCTVNLSLHHSFAFKGHQRVYGFVGFPRASTYWAALVEEQRRNEAIAEAAVTQQDIRRMRAAQRTSEAGVAGAAKSVSRQGPGKKGNADTDMSASRSKARREESRRGAATESGVNGGAVGGTNGSAVFGGVFGAVLGAVGGANGGANSGAVGVTDGGAFFGAVLGAIGGANINANGGTDGGAHDGAKDGANGGANGSANGVANDGEDGDADGGSNGSADGGTAQNGIGTAGDRPNCCLM